MMNTDEIKFRISNIADLVHNILTETENVAFHDFMQNEPLKERVFSQLQEIGQSAFELSKYLEKTTPNKHIFDNLSGFRNARFNYLAEADTHSIWNIIQDDFRNIEEVLMRDLEKYSTNNFA